MSTSTPVKISLAAALIIIFAGGTYLYEHLENARPYQRTDDAYIVADYTIISPRVAGTIKTVAVEDNAHVSKGQLLATLDDRDQQAAVDMAAADLATSRADVLRLHAAIAQQGSVIRQSAAAIEAEEAGLKFATKNAVRYTNLATDGTASIQDAEQANSRHQIAIAKHSEGSAALTASKQYLAVLDAQIQQANARVTRAEAALNLAKLNLSYTRIVAPSSGVIGQRNARDGAYVQIGSPLMAVVPLHAVYIEAKFRETQLARVRPGQQVKIAVDMLPGVVLSGHVDSVAPASHLSFSPIAPDNATGNFTKVVQRLPVKISIDPDQPDARLLKVGMSVQPMIDVSQNPGS